MSMTRSAGRAATRWGVLAVALVAGAVMSVIFAMRGEVALAVASPVIVVGYGLSVTLSAKGSDVAAQLSGHEEDERRQLINLRASAMTGNVLFLVVTIGGFYELASGGLGGPFTWLSAVGGITRVASSVAYTRGRENKGRV
ncbi:hypothetical protein [Streptomyces sp. CT34]|uniref:hypothetical protein n=1 Tax=Streptomyces sp. CT34 TaxID=1553907 RepID=UPI0005B8A98F|nr:hypothetical protein [Streptomyces sp. CT34]